MNNDRENKAKFINKVPFAHLLSTSAVKQMVINYLLITISLIHRVLFIFLENQINLRLDEVFKRLE